MADWAEKIQRRDSSDLLAGEEVVAGVLAKPAGTLDPQIGWMPGGFLGAVSARILQRRGSRRAPEASPNIATSLPESQCVLGLSMHRLMAFGHSAVRGGVKGLVSSVNLSDIKDMEMSNNDVGATLSMAFSDGSTKSYEVFDPIKLGEFVAAFETLQQRPAGR